MIIAALPAGHAGSSEGQFQVWRGLLKYPAEIVLDALQRSFAICLKTQNDRRRGVAGACETKPVRILHTQSVDGDDIPGIGELGFFLQRSAYNFITIPERVFSIAMHEARQFYFGGSA